METWESNIVTLSAKSTKGNVEKNNQTKEQLPSIFDYTFRSNMIKIIESSHLKVCYLDKLMNLIVGYENTDAKLVTE